MKPTTLDDQLRTFSKVARRLWPRVPDAVTTASYAVAFLYIAFVVTEVARRVGRPSSGPIAGDMEPAVFIGLPALGCLVAGVAIVTAWRRAGGWLALLLNVGCGAVVLGAYLLLAKLDFRGAH